MNYGPLHDRLVVSRLDGGEQVTYGDLIQDTPTPIKGS
jgi:hypothetical protein